MTSGNKARAQALVMAGTLLSVPDEAVNRDVLSDTGLDASVIRDELRSGVEPERGALEALAAFNRATNGRFLAAAVDVLKDRLERLP